MLYYIDYDNSQEDILINLVYLTQIAARYYISFEIKIID
jgi:hypothetical protein